MITNLHVFKFVYDIKEKSVFKSENNSIEFPEFSFFVPFNTGRQELAFATQGDEVAVRKGESRTFDTTLCSAKESPFSPSLKGVASLMTTE